MFKIKVSLRFLLGSFVSQKISHNCWGLEEIMPANLDVSTPGAQTTILYTQFLYQHTFKSRQLPFFQIGPRCLATTYQVAQGAGTPSSASAMITACVHGFLGQHRCVGLCAWLLSMCNGAPVKSCRVSRAPTKMERLVCIFSKAFKKRKEIHIFRVMCTTKNNNRDDID